MWLCTVKTRHYKIQMQYTNSAKCDVKWASLVQLLSRPLSVWLKGLSSNFHNHQHPTQAFRILPLESFVSVGKHFYVESAQEAQINSCKSTSQAVSLYCYTQHEWSQEYKFGFQEQGWKNKWTKFLCQGQYKKKKLRKCYTFEIKHCRP